MIRATILAVYNSRKFSGKQFKPCLCYLLVLLRCSISAAGGQTRGVRHEAHHLLHAPAVWCLGEGHGLTVQTRVHLRHLTAHAAGVHLRAGGLMMESKHTDGGRRTVGDGHLWMKTHSSEQI